MYRSGCGLRGVGRRWTRGRFADVLGLSPVTTRSYRHEARSRERRLIDPGALTNKVMMRSRVFIGLTLIALTGCHAAERPAYIDSASVDGRPPNLALGPSAEHAWLATRIAPRSDWPSVRTGYRFDDITYYSKTTYDEESHFDRFGSIYYGSQTVETGVWLR